MLRLVGIFLLIVIIDKIDFFKLLNHLKRINIFYITLVLVLNFPLIFTKSIRWNSILKIQKIHLSLINVFIIYYSSIFLGVISPGRIGEFVKVFYLKMEKDVSFIKGLLNVSLDRLFDLYILVILGLIGIWKFNILGTLSPVCFILLIACISAPILLFNKQFLRRYILLLFNFITKVRCKDESENNFNTLYNEARWLLSAQLIFPVWLTCISLLIFITQCYLLVIAMNIRIDFITITLFMAISRLISLVPISISGLGTRDAALIYLFSLISLTPESAVSYSFLIFVTLFVANGLIGGIAWCIKPLQPNYYAVTNKNPG